jgi:hypothetical protein
LASSATALPPPPIHRICAAGVTSLNASTISAACTAAPGAIPQARTSGLQELLGHIQLYRYLHGSDTCLSHARPGSAGPGNRETGRCDHSRLEDAQRILFRFTDQPPVPVIERVRIWQRRHHQRSENRAFPGVPARGSALAAVPGHSRAVG